MHPYWLQPLCTIWAFYTAKETSLHTTQLHTLTDTLLQTCMDRYVHYASVWQLWLIWMSGHYYLHHIQP